MVEAFYRKLDLTGYIEPLPMGQTTRLDASHRPWRRGVRSYVSNKALLGRRRRR